MNNIEILEEYFNKICFDETNKITADLCTIGINEIQAIENLIQENKELKEENNRIKSLDYTALAEEMEMGLWMPRADVEEYYIPIERLNDYIEKSELSEILKQRLKKYQDADDGEYKQEYLTRGELELVDRYKECSELLKILCKEDIYKIKLDYIPKSKIKEKIEEYHHKDFIKVQVCYQHDNEARIKEEALKELLEEGDDK